MPVVFVVARDWTLRMGVRAELRELGIEALGMESAQDAIRAFSSGTVPAAIVLEVTAEIAESEAISTLAQRVPTIFITSHTETILLPPTYFDAGTVGKRARQGAVFYKPVRIAEIVACVRDLVQKGHAA